MGFDATDRDSVLRHAQRLVGRTAQDIALLASDAGLPWDPNTSKGSAVLLIEQHFGITPNMDAGPDLASAGIEIKSAPRSRNDKGIRAKERTSITMIDYHRIVTEPFEGTGPDRKTRLTLYMFFLWSSGSIARAEDQEVLRVLLHDRDGLDVIALSDGPAHDGIKHARSTARSSPSTRAPRDVEFIIREGQQPEDLGPTYHLPFDGYRREAPLTAATNHSTP